jgi:hypothetical protein
MPYIYPQLKLETFAPLYLFLKLFALANMVQVGGVFPSMEAACNAIQQYVLDYGKSYKTSKSDKKPFILLCKDSVTDQFTGLAYDQAIAPTRRQKTAQ